MVFMLCLCAWFVSYEMLVCLDVPSNSGYIMVMSIVDFRFFTFQDLILLPQILLFQALPQKKSQRNPSQVY